MKDDYISESLFYMLVMKASNEKSLKYQKWIAIEVRLKIRKIGTYNAKDKHSTIDKNESLEVKEMNARIRIANTENLL